MPVEKFYPSAAIEGQPSEVLEVAWSQGGEDYDKVFVMTYQKLRDDSPSEAVINNLLSFDLDRSGLNRLIKALRRARNATFGVDE